MNKCRLWFTPYQYTVSSNPVKTSKGMLLLIYTLIFHVTQGLSRYEWNNITPHNLLKLENKANLSLRDLLAVSSYTTQICILGTIQITLEDTGEIQEQCIYICNSCHFHINFTNKLCTFPLFAQNSSAVITPLTTKSLYSWYSSGLSFSNLMREES